MTYPPIPSAHPFPQQAVVYGLFEYQVVVYNCRGPRFRYVRSIEYCANGMRIVRSWRDEYSFIEVLNNAD